MNYELMVLCAASSDAKAKTTFKQVETILKSVKATDVKQDYWGKRKLAYPIKANTESFYTVFTFKVEAEGAKELATQLNLNEELLRYLLTKQNDKV